MKAAHVKLFAGALRAYRQQLEDLVRMLVRIEEDGLSLYRSGALLDALRRVDAHLKAIDGGTFGARNVGRLAWEIDNGKLPEFDPASAFDNARGVVIDQLRATAKAWARLQHVAQERADIDAEQYDDLSSPESRTYEDRIEWAGDRYSDLADGTLPPSKGDELYQIVYGWSDLGPEHEREGYRRMAARIASLTRSLKEDT